jgi:hypothetical protein
VPVISRQRYFLPTGWNHHHTHINIAIKALLMGCLGESGDFRQLTQKLDSHTQNDESRISVFLFLPPMKFAACFIFKLSF